MVVVAAECRRSSLRPTSRTDFLVEVSTLVASSRSIRIGVGVRDKRHIRPAISRRSADRLVTVKAA